jgi:hypothetical protein
MTPVREKPHLGPIRDEDAENATLPGLLDDNPGGKITLGLHMIRRPKSSQRSKAQAPEASVPM